MASCSSAPKLDTVDWCCTEIRKDCRFTYVWTIKNFSKILQRYGEHIDSPPFSCKEGDTKWCLRLYPRGKECHCDTCILRERNANYALVYLVLISGQEVSATYTLSLLNGQGGKTKQFEVNLPQQFSIAKNAQDAIDNSTRHLQVNGRIFQNDGMTIFCEVGAISFPNFGIGQNQYEHQKVRNELGQLLLDNQEYSDVIISVDGLDLRAHRAVLAARSPVFSAIFMRQMQERKQNRIVITDLCYDTVVAMLRYIYTGDAQDLRRMAQENIKVPPTHSGNICASEILAAADRYQLDGLYSLCQNAWASNLSIETAADVLVVADFHKADYLKQKVIEFINSNRQEVKKTEAWKRASINHSELFVRAFF